MLHKRRMKGAVTCHDFRNFACSIKKILFIKKKSQGTLKMETNGYGYGTKDPDQTGSGSVQTGSGSKPTIVIEYACVLSRWTSLDKYLKSNYTKTCLAVLAFGVIQKEKC